MTVLRGRDPDPPPPEPGPLAAAQARIDALLFELTAAREQIATIEALVEPVAVALERLTATTSCPLYVRTAAGPLLASRKATT